MHVQGDEIAASSKWKCHADSRRPCCSNGQMGSSRLWSEKCAFYIIFVYKEREQNRPSVTASEPQFKAAMLQINLVRKCAMI
jgi:hypothetical protein